MRKKIIFFILLLFVLFSCGCAEITVERYYNRNSSVTDRVSVALDESEIVKYGYTLDGVKSYISNVMINDGYRILESEDKNLVIGEKHYKTRAEFLEAVGNTSNENNAEYDLLFIYNENETYTPYRSLFLNDELKSVIKTEFPNADENLVDDVTYVYKYGTSYKSVESNADYVYENQSGLYVHEWRMNSLEAEHGVLILKQTTPYNTGWYALALLVTLGIAALGFGALEVIIRKEKEEEKNAR